MSHVRTSFPARFLRPRIALGWRHVWTSYQWRSGCEVAVVEWSGVGEPPYGPVTP